METIYKPVAGLDIHKKNIVVCLRKTHSDGSVEEEIRTFSAMTDDLLALCDWLAEQQVTHVAMESTGVLWKPIWNILEGYPFELQLAGARELKQVPGRKSDVKDCQWIAHLLACGLLKSSFVPQPGQRHLRDLTRHRAQLQGEHTRCANRIHKVLQDANIKLSSVATDILGKSGRDMLAALVAGQDGPAAVAELARGKLRKKIPELKRALKGHVWLRRALCEAAWAAGRSNDRYFAAQYRRLAGRRGKQRAIMAVAHSLLVVFYHLLNNEHLQYQELGGNYFDTLDPMRLRRHLVKQPGCN